MIPQKKPSKKDKIRHEKIKAAFAAQGRTFTQVAKASGRTTPYVHNVSMGHYFVPGIALMLSREAAIPVQELWPKEFAAGYFNKYLETQAQ